MPDVELVGIWDADPARAGSAAELAGTRAVRRAEDLVGMVDGVIITSPNTDHRALALLAAAGGVDVLCDKPLATTVADAEAMLEACDRAGVHLMTAFPMRFSPPIRSLEASVRAGELGAVVCLEGVNTGRMPDTFAPWFVDPARSGGGALMDHIVHLADLYRWILRDEVIEVYAVANRVLHDGFDRVETGGMVMLSFAGGAFATIDCSWSKPRSYPTWGGLSIDAIGTAGVIRADAFRQRLAVYGGPGTGVAWPSWGPDEDQGTLDEFVAAVSEQRPPSVSGVDGLRAVEIVAAAYQSVQTEAPVRLKEEAR
jgi:predicted dehydrogenase